MRFLWERLGKVFVESLSSSPVISPSEIRYTWLGLSHCSRYTILYCTRNDSRTDTWHYVRWHNSFALHVGSHFVVQRGQAATDTGRENYILLDGVEMQPAPGDCGKYSLPKDAMDAARAKLPDHNGRDDNGSDCDCVL